MKIIKPGNLTAIAEEMFQVVCPACKCEFVFTRSEGRAGITNLQQPYLKVDCPTCKRGVYKYLDVDQRNAYIK